MFGQLFFVFSQYCIIAIMRNKNADVPIQLVDEAIDEVKLKPFLGIRPGVYLTVLYSIILLAVVFFLLVFPGIKNPGAVLSVKTEPYGAAIRVDDVYMGTSKDKIFVPKGSRTLEAALPGFESESSVHEIPGRVFGSLFFPRRYRVEFTLKTGDPAAALALAAAEYAEWSFGGEPTASWQIPLVLSESAYRTGPEFAPAAPGIEPDDVLAAAARFAVTRAALRDIVRAKFLLDNGGLSPSPAGIAGSVSDILVFLSENPGSAAWLSALLPPESAAMVATSDWRKNEQSSRQTQSAAAAGRIAISGLNFYNIGGVYISENPVPRSLYQTFLNENPSWRESGVDLGGDEATGVSWFAAQAFCEWFTNSWLQNSLPPSMAAMEARLPTEAELELATAISLGNESGWEWCADPFAPLPFIKAPQNAVLAVSSPERAVRNISVAVDNRASLPPELSSPFVTFRPVIAEK